MTKKYKFFFILIISLTMFLTLFINSYINLDKDFRVAHAGGEYNDKFYSNSVASIEYNKKFTKYFELDLQLTKDYRLVCLHDPLVDNKYFHEIKNEILRNGNCYDKTLKKLLKNNNEIFIITDFKTNNIEGLNFIKDYFKNEINRFIPQIFYENEYEKVKNLGFSKIIFTFYRINNYSNDKISNIIEHMDLFAITMDPARLRSGILKKIDKNKFIVFVYTVNSYVRFFQYKLFYGADNIYTDNLF